MINRDLTEQKIANWVEEARNSFDNHRGARSAILALLGAGIGAAGTVLIDPEKFDRYDLLYNALAGAGIGAGIGAVKKNKGSYTPRKAKRLPAYKKRY